MNTRLAELHADLQTRYREYFESKLAITLLQKPELFLSVHAVSKIMVFLLEEHKEQALLQISNNKKIAEDLYHVRYFGRLSRNELPTSRVILNDMLEILNDASSELKKTMQIHSIFTYRIYPRLKNISEEKHIQSNRCRLEINTKTSLSKQLGIARNNVFNKMISIIDKNEIQHARAIDRFKPDIHSTFFKSISEKNIPFIAGPSGHTASLMKGAVSYGLNTVEMLKQYALACFAFLAGGGNHSFHEVMIAANQVGVPFEINNYEESLPSSFRDSSIYKKLCEEFPQFLDSINRSERVKLIGKNTFLFNNLAEIVVDYELGPNGKPVNNNKK